MFQHANESMWMLFVDVYDVKAQREVPLTPGQPSSLINLSPLQNAQPFLPKIEPPRLQKCSEVHRPRAVFHRCGP